MDDLNFINDFRLIFHAGSEYSEERIRNLLRGLFSIRGMDDLAISAHRHLFRAIKSGESFYGKCVYPCDVVELRDILTNFEIVARKPIVLFSNQVMKQAVDGYNVLLLLNCEPDDLDCDTAGGMIVLDSHRLNIKGKIAGVILQKSAHEPSVRKIVHETIPSCPVHGERRVPGIDQKKVIASANKRFRIKLPSLHIYDIIVADSDIEAVNKALSTRWDRHPDSRTERKPARYSAEYWYYSGFWDGIVKDASVATTIKTAQGQPQITLSQQEQEIFNTIMAIDQEFGLGQQYRVAGGWVRDKLLGKESDDIDIALDKMTGQKFSDYANQYAERHPEAPIGKRYVVEQNADKSKHLETTALEIGGSKIDFVNLRTEDYADDSRVPEMKFGTPEEDASRRDLTINSLFYNISNGQIEDYVGGLEDLETLTLRTPLDPKQTFMDDPLRMLRALRFYSRYEGSQLDPALMQAMGDSDVHESYRRKVAPERAGPEIMKLFSGAKPEEAMRALYESGMDAAILNLPDFEGFNPFNMSQMNPHHQLNLQDHTFKVMRNMNQVLSSNGVEGKDRALALMATWFHDFGKMHPDIQKPRGYKAAKPPNPDVPGDLGSPGEVGDPEHMSYHGHEDVSAELSEAFLKSIGIGKNDRQFVNMIVKEHMFPHAHDGVWNKRKMGKLRQKTTIPGQEDRTDLWKFVLWHGHADAAAKSEESTLEDFPEYQERFDATQDYMNAPPPMKPLLDGKKLMQMFTNIHPKTGFIGFINQRLMGEQQAGNIVDPMAAEAFVDSIRPEIEAFVENIRPEVENTYSQPTNMEKQMYNWYRRKIKADASSASPSGEYGSMLDSDNWNERRKDQKNISDAKDTSDKPKSKRKKDEKTMIIAECEDEKKMLRYEPGQNNRLQKGDRVKRRQRPLSSEPIVGKVISKEKGMLKVRWQDGSEQEFDMNDIELPLLLERI